ncbi:hypothetical protein UFOVP464_6 [uncultured Caudovirales phage]|uniref:Uncharacterized protein n=1 Tax=uncultured Caudovirales phage TaxID=2100421 RepID=A0A6J5QZM8_9CAUD|nr:hypothetical protein UFOVP464_6 [uncultured Caudovirales phage]CAB4189232.1 hypothetical protein UFOVP1189_21 [uncultured Caudovirales phage]
MPVLKRSETTSIDLGLAQLWADRLGLQEWTIYLDSDMSAKEGGDTEDAETQAATSPLASYREATIRAGATYPTEPGDRELTIVHELCHILLADLARAAEVTVEAAPKGAREALLQQAEDAQELTVVRLSRALFVLLAKDPA